MKHRYNLTGKKSGTLTFQSFSRMDKFGKSIWNADCSCGKNVEVRADRLGIIQSCGCQTKRITKEKNFKGAGPAEGGLPRRYWTRLKWNAKARGHELKITIQEAYNLFQKQNKQCILSGVDLQFGPDDSTTTASLDRIDSRDCYKLGNVRWIHKTINLMKNILSEPVFLDWISRIYKHQNENKTI